MDGCKLRTETEIIIKDDEEEEEEEERTSRSIKMRTNPQATTFFFYASFKGPTAVISLALSEILCVRLRTLKSALVNYRFSLC